jgi:hypothetical protein
VILGATLGHTTDAGGGGGLGIKLATAPLRVPPANRVSLGRAGQPVVRSSDQYGLTTALHLLSTAYDDAIDPLTSPQIGCLAGGQRRPLRVDTTMYSGAEVRAGPCIEGSGYRGGAAGMGRERREAGRDDRRVAAGDDSRFLGWAH